MFDNIITLRKEIIYLIFFDNLTLNTKEIRALLREVHQK
jgi:hypothetical protein